MRHSKIFIKFKFLFLLLFPILVTANPPDWTPVPNLLYNMNIICKLQLEDNSYAINPNYIIAGFVDEECRGVVSPNPAQNGLLFFTIGSNEVYGETITFKAYLSDQNMIVDLNEVLTFQNLLMIGTVGEPFIFTFEHGIFSVSFSIQSAEGQTIDNATITLGELTNDPGDYIFENVGVGSYSYTVVADGYIDVHGIVEVESEDVDVSIIMTESSDIPSNLVLAENQHLIIGIEQTICFDALETIMVAGGNYFFIIEAGGSATLIAGQSIHLLPGTAVEQGGYLLARIAAHEDDYCGIPRAIEIAKEPVTSKDEDVVSADFPYEIRENGFFKLYPNPTDGTFTLELTTAEIEFNITVEVHSMLGRQLFIKELPPQRLHSLSLEGQQPGMYIIRIMKGDRVGVERLIKR